MPSDIQKSEERYMMLFHFNYVSCAIYDYNTPIGASERERSFSRLFSRRVITSHLMITKRTMLMYILIGSIDRIHEIQ